MNPLLDRTPVSIPWFESISAGWLSFLSILLRFLIVVSTMFLLLAGTGMPRLCNGLNRLCVPNVLTNQLLFLYRYLFVIGEELMKKIQACELRMVNKKSLPIQYYKHIIASALSQAMERAIRIHEAMLLRGYNGQLKLMYKEQWRITDSCYVLFWITYVVTIRIVDVPDTIGKLVGF